MVLGPHQQTQAVAFLGCQLQASDLLGIRIMGPALYSTAGAGTQALLHGPKNVFILFAVYNQSVFQLDSLLH